ncbi:MAG: hypothetical protein V3V45_08435 [Candidatus Brocadiales bacterium]
MSRLVIIIALLALSLPATAGQEKADNTEEAKAQDIKAGATEKPTTGKRDFLKLAGPETEMKKKKKGSHSYSGYWTSLYKGKNVEIETDEETGRPVGPSFSPYYAEPARPVRPQRPQTPAKPDELQILPLTPPPLEEFTEVDFGKFASGSYVTEYADKFVQLRCKFASIAPRGMRLKQFPAPKYVNFLVTGTGSTMFSLTVAVPSAKASKVFGLESQKEIILYGRVVKLGLNELTLLVEEVEPK